MGILFVRRRAFCVLNVQARSGSVALPRVKLAPARPACLPAKGADARSAARAMFVLRRVDDMSAIDLSRRRRFLDSEKHIYR